MQHILFKYLEFVAAIGATSLRRHNQTMAASAKHVTSGRRHTGLTDATTGTVSATIGTGPVG
jgi:hypothetical protein